MAFTPHDLSVFMAVILIIGATRVLLSLVYLGEQKLAAVQPPYTVPSKRIAPAKGREAGKRATAHSGEDAIGDLPDRIHELAPPPKENDLHPELEADLQRSRELNGAPAAAVKKIADFQSRLSRLKNTSLHEELGFWLSGARSCPDFGRGLYLLSVVYTEPLRETQRSGIRQTWGGVETAEGANVSSVFLVRHQTSQGTAESLRKRVRQENAKNGDVIGADVVEPKDLTTLSTMGILAAFKWVLLNCPLVEYVFIGPDNLFVDPVNMVKQLKTFKSPRDLYLGRVRKDGNPQRDPNKKDFIGVGTYRPESYPKYCLGGAGFVVSTNFMQNAYLKSIAMTTKAKDFYLGDVYLGMLALNLKVWPKYKETFLKLGGDADYCELRETITLGGFGSESLMKSVWKNHSMVVPNCPNPTPNATEIEQWTRNTNNKRYFDMVLKLFHNPKKTCWKDPTTSTAPFLLAVVSSMPEHIELRSAIRQTWAAPDYMNMTNSKTIFILGKSRGMSVATQQAVDEEALQHHDILQADFRESFHNLTLKVILGLRWVSNNCKKAAFVYKGDDDMLVNFERITDYLRSLPANQSERLFLGNMMSGSPVLRERSKYQVLRSQYPFRYFLPYFSGGGYIMSSAAVKDMNKMTLSTKLIPIDDAYAGILAFRSIKPINLSAASSKKFITTGSRKDACYLRDVFNIHGFKLTSVIKETWTDFRNLTKQCEDPKKHKLGHKNA